MLTTAALTVLALVASETLAASPAAAQSQEQSYVPITPARILDTRDATHGDLSASIGADSTASTTVTGVGGVPAGASAVAINVTAVEPSRAGYLTIYPTGESLPLAASINFPADSIVGNQINVKVGTDGTVDIYNFRGSTDVVFDVVGYYHDQRQEALETDIATLDSTVSDQATEISSLESTVSDQTIEISALQTLLEGVSRQDDAQGRDTLVFAGMNLQVVNDTGDTDGAPNGLGNLIIGYDTERETGSDKSGSHYLVTGDEHNYTRFGGILAGRHNTAGGDYASVSGGIDNTASGTVASVTGGVDNTASGNRSSVSGGESNTASGLDASVSGGSSNTASGIRASVSGGFSNTAGDRFVSVSGGSGNTASEWFASISGGRGNIASARYASVVGGWFNTADGNYSSILGGSSILVDSTVHCHPDC